MMLLSALMRVYNEAEMLGKCLDNLVSFCDEVIVVDGGSTDGSKEIAADFPRVKLLHWTGGSASEQVFYTPALPAFQMALDAAQGEWVFIVDADERPCLRMQHQLRPILAQTPADHLAIWGVHMVTKYHYQPRWVSYAAGRLVRRRVASLTGTPRLHDTQFQPHPQGQAQALDMALFHLWYWRRQWKIERYEKLGIPHGSISEAVRGSAWFPTTCEPSCERCLLNDLGGVK